MPSAPYLPLTPRIRMVGYTCGSVAFAVEVRRAVAEWSPGCIAVELPRALSAPLFELLDALPEVRNLAYRTADLDGRMIPGDPCHALVEAARLARELGLALEFVDTLEAGRHDPFPDLPDEHIVSIAGYAAYAERIAASSPTPEPTPRTLHIAWHLGALADRHERVLFAGSLGHYAVLDALLDIPAAERRPPPEKAEGLEWRIATFPERHLGALLYEMPALANLYEGYRASNPLDVKMVAEDALAQLLRDAAAQYKKEYKETVSLTEWRALHQYGRNLSLIRDRLRPGLYELVMAAKGCVDDDFGGIVLERATAYPPNAKQANPFDEPAEEPRRISPHFHEDFGAGLERLAHAYPFPPVGEVQFHFRRRRPSAGQRLAWAARFAHEFLSGSGICSWPPEDFFVENFFRKVRARAHQQIADKHTTIEEFSTSALDGLDLRETVRRWHSGKVYVRRERIPPGRIGPVVVAWEDRPLRDHSLWRTSLYAENQNESDIAFYSTVPGNEMVGPGITRIEYLGILSVYPARGIPDVWTIPGMGWWQTCARALLVSAILLSEERYIAYLGPQAPDPEILQLARDHKRAIIYLPLASFGKSLLKRARQCHILSSKKVRGYAGDYIPE